ncbi:MAG: MEMO1 family protein [Candidatus Micrarchaeia archaeon]
MREMVFSGSFYPSSRSELNEMLDEFIKDAKINLKERENVISAVAPHAGYIYSGRTAAFTYKLISEALKKNSIDTFIIIGPNHTGLGKPIAVSKEDWSTPFGVVKNDRALSDKIVKSSKLFEFDEEAHAEEHSIEVQLPFLQKIVKEPKCVFICMGDQSYENAVEMSKIIYESALALNKKIFIIASSDMNHYEDANTANKKDTEVLDALKALDIPLFYNRIDEYNDTMCGYGPVATAALFSIKNKAKEARILNYSNSGNVTKDYISVVAYASIAFLA